MSLQLERYLPQHDDVYALLGECVVQLGDSVVITGAEPLESPGPIILFVNDAFVQTTGYSREDVIGKSPRMLQGQRTDRDEVRRIGQALHRWERVRTELINYTKGGTAFYVEMDIVPIADKSGRYTHWVSVQRDVTARKLAESEAAQREAQRVESLGALTAGIAHDFNNIVAAILGNVAIADSDLVAGRNVKPSLVQIQVAGLRARSLIKQILAYSRRERTAFSHQNLSSVFTEATDLLRSTIPAGVTVNVTESCSAQVVSCDNTQMTQVLLNLGTNAWHSLPSHGGKIDFHLSSVTLPDASCKQGRIVILPPGRYAQITVSDNGCGMDDITKARVFEPYFTTKALGVGTGLGLSVVHAIVKAHGGAIDVESREGHGTTFTLLVPVVAAEQVAIAAPAPRKPTAFTGAKRVMVIDDDEVLLLMMEGVLTRAGFEVTCFSDPRDAVRAIGQTPHSFDAVITDHNMPHLSGIDVALQISAIRGDLPIVLGSGYLSEELEREALDSGIVCAFNKETLVEELNHIMFEALAMKNAEQKARRTVR
jgi:PAS domain S-box-containing protein